MTANRDHPRINRSKRMDTTTMAKIRSISQSEYDLLVETRAIIGYTWSGIDVAQHVLKYLIEHQAMRDGTVINVAPEAWSLFARQGAEYVSALLGRSTEELDAGYKWATKSMGQGPDSVASPADRQRGERRKPKRERGAARESRLKRNSSVVIGSIGVAGTSPEEKLQDLEERDS